LDGQRVPGITWAKTIIAAGFVVSGMKRSTIDEKLKSLPHRGAAFIEPMECLAVTKIPDDQTWLYEVKLDGYRALAVNSSGAVNLFSRRRNSFNRQYPLVYKALSDLPENSVIDGEIVALDEKGRPDFNLLQHYAKQASRIHYFVFDLLVYKDQDLTRLPLIVRRDIMRSVLTFRSSRVRTAQYFETSAQNMLAAAQEQGLEGVIAKRKSSIYAPGQRTGSWVKYRLNRGQELVIGGYTPGAHGFDSIIIGYYKEDDLIYVARVRNGFVTASRRQVFEKLRPLVIPNCPFTNLPEEERSRWREGLTAEDMKRCVWVRPQIVAQVQFLEWTDGDHLRHAKFAGLRDDKDPRSVTKEHAGEG
jgi:DNA ligase D-like protein (predicted ligase)